MSQSFAAEIPDNILSLQKPLFDDQADKVLKITVSAGSIREHPISVTKGSYVKWSFCCDDSTIRFSVVLNVQGTQEIRMIEDAHRVKGDGRYDIGEIVCDDAGVLTLVWDNTYSLITSREVNLRIGVKHPKSNLQTPNTNSEQVETIGVTPVASVEEKVLEPTAEPTTEPVTESTAESVSEPVSEPTTEPVSEPVSEPVVEPTAEQTAELTPDQPTQQPLEVQTEEPAPSEPLVNDNPSKPSSKKED
ncbi:hypothetical protein JH06_4911 [Blastocystis sp. subtype 4]|uniref:hypothetical protein n=1 Tax=Blastocystis sp. subtype 4 TaxID=944170 RepID=UPI000711A66C|nr:hypothetical protein JH06_4911 [Blastocystis sp. subtype 4]KNB42379.1 hypothetical protein JH06_4911 [Blastocystis sp. subtype 4]|eukprot:XP_014525822.1 hypothetical protein JH06_4911 [Blastocystis sp. subtype 4]